MLTDAQASRRADQMQADYYQSYFDERRSSLAAELASQVRQLTAVTATGDAASAGRIRRAIRNAESDLRTIDRMLEAIDGRFPDELSDRVRRRA